MAAGFGIGAAVWAGDDHASGAEMSPSAAEGHGSESMTETATLDEHAFLEQMVPHHESAIEMANLALGKIKRPEIRLLAQQILAAQSKEIGQMQRLREQWFPPLG